MILRHIFEHAHEGHFARHPHLHDRQTFFAEGDTEQAQQSGRRRFRGGPGHGPFGGGRGRRGGFGSARRIGATELQAVLLSLLAESPRHGYELIRALDERTGGFYVPSPGMVYPALTYLEEIGYATVEAEGARKRYHITPEGQAHLDENRALVDAILAEFDRLRPRMEEFRSAVDGDEDLRRGGPFATARHALRSALHEKRHSSAEELARIAAILQRAADEIRA